MSTNRNPAVRIVLPAVLGALSFLLYYVHFALVVFPSYLTYDPGDLPALVAAVAAGPLAGIGVEVVKNLLYLVLGAGTPVGVAANTLAGSVYVAVAVLAARRRSRRPLATGLVAATILTAIVMTVTNAYIWLPAYGIPRAQASALLWPAILPFNLVKFAITSVLGYLLVVALKPVMEARRG